MKLIIPILLALIFAACHEQTVEPDEKDFLLVGKSGKEILSPYVLGNSAYVINDTCFTDTLHIYLGEDHSSEFLFIYVGQVSYIDEEGGKLSKPIKEQIIIKPVRNIMLLQGISISNEIYTVAPMKYLDALNQDLPWVWLYEPIYYRRNRNESIGPAWGLDKHYIGYFDTIQQKLGWIEFRMVFDDIYFEELLINEYGEQSME